MENINNIGELILNYLKHIDNSIKTYDLNNIYKILNALAKQSKKMKPTQIKYLFEKINPSAKLKFNEEDATLNFDVEKLKDYIKNSQSQYITHYLNLIYCYNAMITQKETVETICMENLNVGEIESYLVYPIKFHYLSILSKLSDLQSGRISEELINSYLKFYRILVLSDDQLGQAHVYNLILRAHYLNGSFSALTDFVQKTDWAQGSTELTAKYNFYLGVSSCVGGNYQQALSFFLNSISKAPNHSVGYRLLNAKWKVLTELLLGLIPEKKAFSEYFEYLLPYFELANAVRVGDLLQYNSLLANPQYLQCFTEDKTLHVVMRLQTTVVRVLMRKIGTVFQNVYLSDLRAKLGNISLQDVELIMSKNIQEGILAGQITRYKDDLIFTNKSSDVLFDSHSQNLRMHSNIEKMYSVYNDASQAMIYQDKLINNNQNTEREMSLDELILDMEFL